MSLSSKGKSSKGAWKGQRLHLEALCLALTTSFPHFYIFCLSLSFLLCFYRFTASLTSPLKRREAAAQPASRPCLGLTLLCCWRNPQRLWASNLKGHRTQGDCLGPSTTSSTVTDLYTREDTCLPGPSSPRSKKCFPKPYCRFQAHLCVEEQCQWCPPAKQKDTGYCKNHKATVMWLCVFLQ